MVLISCLLILTAAIVSTPLCERLFSSRAGYLYAAVFAGILGLLWSVADEILGSTDYIEYSTPWIKNLDVHFAFRLDGLGLIFGSLVLGIGVLVLMYSVQYLPKNNNASFYALIMLFAVAMLGLVLVNDVIVLFVFWEFTTLSSFFLISRSGVAGYYPSFRTLLITTFGGLCLLAAVVTMTTTCGTSRISKILIDPIWSDNKGLAATVAVLVIVAALTKSAQFPFHAWLPDAMVATMPVSAYLHAAAMVKAGIFLLMRFSPIFSNMPIWNVLLISIGLTTMIMGALFALQRDDMKELLAYSTVSQLGLLVAAIGVGTTYALAAACLHVISHALFKSSLFMMTGTLEKQTGTRMLSKLGGIGKVLPVSGIAVTLAALSSAGFIPFLGFVSKESVLTAFLDAPGPIWVAPVTTTIVVLGSIITFAYSGKIVLTMWQGNAQAKKRLPFLALAPLIAATLSLFLGIAVVVLNDAIEAATQAALNTDYEEHLRLWHGFTTEFLLTDIVIVAGLTLSIFRDRVSVLLHRGLFPHSGVYYFESLRKALELFARRIAALTRSDSPPRHIVMPLVLLMGLGLWVWSGPSDITPTIENSMRVSDWFLLCLLIILLGGLLMAKSRIAGVVLLGSTGLIMTLFFFTLGAPDVGMTQLLVELLTVIFMMFSLRRLPKTFHHTAHSRKILAAIVAIATGVLSASMSYYFTGRRDISDLGLYFLNNAKTQTGGSNVVNTILVDFRALDTLGELTVLATAGLAIMALLGSVQGVLQAQRRPHFKHRQTAADSFGDNNIPVRILTRALLPLSGFMSAYLMLKGHSSPGGGFIAALVTCIAIALLYLGTTHRDFIEAKGLPYLFIASGIMIAVATSLSGYIDGTFLTPLHADLHLFGLDLHISTSLLFDLGVYLAVVGVVLAAINRLSLDPTAHVLASQDRLLSAQTADMTVPEKS